MSEYKSFQQKRRVTQLLSSLVFIAILTLGWYYPFLGFFIPFCMFLGLGIGFVKGRKWCDWYCPRGSFFDALMGLISPKKAIPGIFRNISFRLGVLSILMIIMALNLIWRWPSAYKVGLFFVTLLTITTGLGIILSLIFHQRAWCMICPIGTLVNLAGRNKRPLKINPDLCVECKSCEKACPVQLKPYQFKSAGIEPIKDYDCLKCGSCVNVCPKEALTLK